MGVMFRCGAFIPLGPLAAVVLITCLSGCNSDDSSYQLGGKVSGLASGREVTLLNNGGDATTVAVNGSFISNWAQLAASSDGTHLAVVSTGGSPPAFPLPYSARMAFTPPSRPA